MDGAADHHPAGREATVSILIGSEHSLFREAIKAALEREADCHVVGEAADGLQAISEARRVGPDVALLDVRMARCDGVKATRLLKEKAPDCRVLLLADGDDHYSLLPALQAGAKGFVTKGSPLAELIGATRAVHRGETVVPGRLLGPLLDQLLHRRSQQDQVMRKIARLTKREREVLAQLVEGGNNAVIARKLVISPETARTHIQNILGKLDVHSRLEAVALVTESGVIDSLSFDTDTTED
jgi:DNA-binding NarL/FixJ family response regulator